MRMILAFVAAAAMTCTVSTSVRAAETATGTWSIYTENAKVQMETRYEGPSGHDHDRHSDSVDPAKLGIAQALASSGQHVTFQTTHEAGRFDFDGWLGNGKGGGTYLFTVNQAFFDTLRSRGYAADSIEEKMAAADLDLTTEYIEAMNRDGLRADSFGQLISMKAVGVTPEYVAELRGAGIGPVDAGHAITLRALNVDGAYVHDMASVGFSHLEPSQYVTLKALHVDSSYVKYLQAHGFKNLTVGQVITMKAEKI